MVKKLKILVIIILLSFSTFSQNDTNRICLPYSIAQKVAIELVQKDSLESELKVTNQILKETQYKCSIQDSIIVSFEKKEIEYKAEIKLFEEKEKLSKDKITSLESTNADLVKKNHRLKSLSQWLGGGLIGTLAIIVTYVALK